MNKVVGRVAKFRINPGAYNPYKPSFKHYYDVHIFDQPENLWYYGYRRTEEEKNKEGYGALTIPCWREKYDPENKTWIISPKIGDALFYQDRLDTIVIAHESVHLATSFLRILNKFQLNDEIDEAEELFAYCVGSIARQIVNKLYELKIL